MLKHHTSGRSRQQRRRDRKAKAAAKKTRNVNKWRDTLPARRELANTFHRLNRSRRIKTGENNMRRLDTSKWLDVQPESEPQVAQEITQHGVEATIAESVN